MTARRIRITPGARVQTNARFAALFTPPVARPWIGSVVRAHVDIPGCWSVRVDGIERLQYVNEKFLEVMP